jgi:hypothetical protein
VAAPVTHPYKKLPGKARTLVTTSRLWLGDDHILLVKSTRIVEEYRRFYFPDVQAMIIRRTMPFHYGWAAALFAAALLTARLSRSPVWTGAVVAASAAFLWLRGPACVCHLHTAVQTERLPSLHRIKTAERVTAILREQIEQRQGALADVPDDLQQPLPWALPAPPPLPPSGAEAEDASLAPHLTLFAVILASSLLAGAAMFTQDSWARASVPVASMIEFVFLVPVLAWQTGRRLPRALTITTWAAAVRWFAVVGPAWAIQQKAAIVDRTTRDLSPWAIPVGNGWIGWLNLWTLAFIGAAGLVFAATAALSKHSRNGGSEA